MAADGAPLAPPVRAYPSAAVQRVYESLHALRVELLALHPELAEGRGVTLDDVRVRAETGRPIDAQIENAQLAAGSAVVRAMRDAEGK